MTRSRELAEASSAYDGGGSLSFRNRIINGDMRIDQRNGGASVNGDSKYPVDRWTQFVASNFFSLTSQQSSTAPAGFTKSIQYTATTAGTATSTQYAAAVQKIEGSNVADLGWGTANAQAVTLSFWVRSSLTGAFSGAVKNGAENRSYPFSFTINAANTFEYKTITIPGDTSGTWLTDTGTGMGLSFDLGSGSTYRGAAGAWASAGYTGVTGAVSFSQTLNATFYITGVQLEAGSVATPFERRPYGTELALCQRYLPAYIASASGYLCGGFSYSTTNFVTLHTFNVTPRVPPTGITTVGAFGGHQGASSFTISAAAVAGSNTEMVAIVQWASSGLTVGQAGYVYTTGAGKVLFTGCEL